MEFYYDSEILIYELNVNQIHSCIHFSENPSETISIITTFTLWSFMKIYKSL